MSPRYIRSAPTNRDTWSAAIASCAVAASVGLVTFYLARILLSRDGGAVARPEGSGEPARSTD
jgi:hypothetical protein